jgi:DNA-binding response OmpR family regulator
VRHQHTILIVDDDPSFLELYRGALRFHGFRVDTASDGWKALQAIENRRPSLVLLDLNLPRVDGHSVLRELTQNPAISGIPVIVVTGSDVNEATIQVDAILKKPVLPDDVLPVIERRLLAG